MKFKVTLSDKTTLNIEADSAETASKIMEHRLSHARMMGVDIQVVKIEEEQNE